MSTFTATDEIRARGAGITLAECENCKRARAMDDLHRLERKELVTERDGLVAGLVAARQLAKHCGLALGAALFVILLLGISDMGWFKP